MFKSYVILNYKKYIFMLSANIKQIHVYIPVLNIQNATDQTYREDKLNPYISRR